MLTLPALGDIVAPLVLAALCGAAVAFFSAGPRQSKWGAPIWPPTLFKRGGYAPSDSPASVR
jgi:hypothetical protein